MDFSFASSQSLLSLNSTLQFSIKPSPLRRSKLLRPPQPASLVVARAGFSHCEPSSSSSFSLNTPLEPCSAAGKYLISVFQNQPQLFRLAVADELKLLADDRNAAASRMFLSSRSDEASLHRRIAQLKEDECQAAVEDVMYLLILGKFAEIRVHLVPRLSRCICNGRLEIGPSKDWDLESIHSSEALQMIREHVCAVIGLRANSSVLDGWATTEIQRLHLCRVYTASVLYGYFLKSASLRHYLEQCLARPHHNAYLGCQTARQNVANLVFGGVSNVQSKGSSKQDTDCEKLRCYVMGFDADTLQRCANLKSKEAENLIGKYSRALFGNDETGLVKDDEVILTSFSSLRRLVLEAVAFGYFLWDTEEYVNSVFKLNENN